MQDYRTLIRRIRSGDDSAFDELYVAAYPRALRVARRYAGAGSAAEDLVHDTFLSLWEKRHSLSEDEQVDLYIITSIRNRAFNITRHEQYVKRAEGVGYDSTDNLPPGSGSGVGSSAEQIDLDDVESAIKRAIDALPEIQRTVINLRWKSQMSYDAIAEELGISVKVVRLSLERAYNALRPLLEHLMRD